MPDLPAPSRFATYNGVVEANLGAFRGPTTQGELMMIVSREVYRDEQSNTDKTRVGFAYTGRRIPSWMGQ